MRAIGLSGKPTELAAVVKQCAAFYEKVPVASAAGYVINHTTYVYLLDPAGRVRHLFQHEDPPERIAELVSRLHEQSCCH